jgi:hypothetical protein
MPAWCAALVGSVLAPSWPWAWVSLMVLSSRSPALLARSSMPLLPVLAISYPHKNSLLHNNGRMLTSENHPSMHSGE